MDSLDGLDVLRAVIDAGSFVRAGDTLGLTQSAVSRAVARLEDRVGVRMFRRTARAISLTDDGRRYYDAVAPHLAAIEEATIEAGGSTATVRGRLRVNIDTGIGAFVMLPRLQPFLAAHPELSVELEVHDRMGDLVREGFDVAVRFGMPQPSALKARLLLRSRIVTCAAPSYLERHGTPRKPSDIERHQCILMRDPQTGRPFGWELVRGKQVVAIQAKGQLMVNDGSAMRVACIAGQGIAQLLELYVRRPLADGRLVHLLPRWSDETYPLYAYYHASPLMPAKVRAFLDFVVEMAR